MSFAAIASIAGPILSGFMAKGAADDAAGSQVAANQQSLALRREVYDQTRKDTKSYTSLGNKSNKRLEFLMGLGGGGNPNVRKAKSAVKQAQNQLNSLNQVTHNTGGGPTWIPPNYPQDADVEGYWAPPKDRWATGQTMGGGSTSKKDMRSAQRDLKNAEKALLAAQDEPWKKSKKHGSLMDEFEFSEDDPSYQWRFDEGMKGVENSAAARGMQLSGATLKGLTRWGQGAASQEYQSAWNRDAGYKNRQYNYLAGTSNRGLSATGINASAGQNYAQGGSNAYSGIGDAQAAGSVAGTNALTQGAGQAYSNYNDINTQNRLNAILRGNPGYGGSSYGGNLGGPFVNG